MKGTFVKGMFVQLPCVPHGNSNCRPSKHCPSPNAALLSLQLVSHCRFVVYAAMYSMHVKIRVIGQARGRRTPWKGVQPTEESTIALCSSSSALCMVAKIRPLSISLSACWRYVHMHQSSIVHCSTINQPLLFHCHSLFSFHELIASVLDVSRSNTFVSKMEVSIVLEYILIV